MATLKVQTALQDNWIPNVPCRVTKPVPAKAGGQVNPPTFATVTDANGKLNIFWLLQGETTDNRVLYNVWYDDLRQSWVEEDTTWTPLDTTALHTGFIKAALHPTRKSICVLATNTFNINIATPPNVNINRYCYIYYIELNGRYPRWQTASIGQGTWAFDCLSVDLAFDDDAHPIISYSRSCWAENPTINFSDGPWIWSPSGAKGIQYPNSTTAMPPKDSKGNQYTPMIWDISYGKSPDWSFQDVEPINKDHRSNWRWYYVLGYQSDNNDTVIRTQNFWLVPEPMPSSPATVVEPNTQYQTMLRTIHLDDTGTSPLLIGLRSYSDNTSKVLFFPNDYYIPQLLVPPVSSPSAPIQLFGDVPGKAVWIEATTRPYSGGIDSTVSFGIDVFGIFEITDSIGKLTGVEVWHTQTLDGLIIREDFGIFTREPDGKWVSDVITSSSAATTGTKAQCYSVDIASVDDNGLPTPGVKGTFGTSIATIININGSDVALQPGHEVDITFNLAGRCGLTVETWGSIIPNTYSLWVKGMDDDARIDIQPGPQDLHTKLANVTADQVKAIAGPKVDDAHIQTAVQCLREISTIVTGPPELLSSIKSEYLHPRTSPHIARSSRQGHSSHRLGKLPVGYEHAFHISFKNGFSCTKLRRAQAEALMKELSSPFGFLGTDWGDLWNNLKGGIFSVVDIVVSVGESAVNIVMSGISALKDAANWVWKGIVDLATQAADIAGAVFEYIKSTWDLVVQWLGFLFNWGDIKLTAQHFQKVVHDTDMALLDFIDNTLQPLGTKFFDNVRANMDSWFTSAGSTVGHKTFGEYANSSVTAKGQVGSVFPVLDILDEIPSPGMWLLNKLLGILEWVFEGEPIEAGNDTGIDVFLTSMRGILDTLYDRQLQADCKAAIQSVQNMIDSITTNSIFDSITLGAVMSVIHALATVSIDLVKNLFTLLLNVSRYIVARMIKFIENPIYLPGISWLYEQITGTSMPSLSEVVCFCLAIPFTFAFKIIYNEAPYVSSSKDGNVVRSNTLTMSGDQWEHAAHAVFKLCTTGYGLWSDIETTAIKVNTSRSQVVWTILRFRSLASVAPGFNITAPNNTSNVDWEAKTMGYLTIILTVLRVSGGYIDMKISGRPLISSKEATVRDMYLVAEGFLGIAQLICGIYEASQNPAAGHDTIATVQLFFSGFGNVCGFCKTSVAGTQVNLVASVVSSFAYMGVISTDFALAAKPAPSVKKAITGGADEVELEE
ncbi:uncharacterized protein CDV56_107860 [Aspergillus thermomutatus]|uniref:Uncharacterized protein n=1 Tax=Aspergillus thermomutatus TaxID=41047 RepID=A0A397H0Z3_ASPTH|nr:uncharacterized protein CDV56_107860 [Aspergillus thermomutatus]RHZ56607.1 hypothetical protein CDV56_107860 [Aspergillus thermomutatus]